MNFQTMKIHDRDLTSILLSERSLGGNLKGPQHYIIPIIWYSEKDKTRKMLLKIKSKESRTWLSYQIPIMYMWGHGLILRNRWKRNVNGWYMQNNWARMRRQGNFSEEKNIVHWYHNSASMALCVYLNPQNAKE